MKRYKFNEASKEKRIDMEIPEIGFKLSLSARLNSRSKYIEEEIRYNSAGLNFPALSMNRQDINPKDIDEYDKIVKSTDLKTSIIVLKEIEKATKDYQKAIQNIYKKYNVKIEE